MRIIHVFRSPVGGLFRHVRDLVRGQSSNGHDVGLICDSVSGGGQEQILLSEIQDLCSLGITRLPMRRLPSIDDFRLAQSVAALALVAKADILHGHGAKGGLYARLAAPKMGAKSVYSPHGGSLHYAWNSPAGAAFLAAEKYLARKGNGIVFVCEFEKRLFGQKIGYGGKLMTVVYNGLWPEEFVPTQPSIDAADLLFVGEVRALKGIDVLLQAIKLLQSTRIVSLAIVGDGPDLPRYQALAVQLGIAEQVSFKGRKPIREAFKLGKLMVVPSRNESFPYVVLETVAAGVPLIATAVGGIPEILPPNMLVDRPDATLLANRIREVLDDPGAARVSTAELSKKVNSEFSAADMAHRVTAFYDTLRVSDERPSLIRTRDNIT